MDFLLKPKCAINFLVGEHENSIKPCKFVSFSASGFLQL